MSATTTYHPVVGIDPTFLHQKIPAHKPGDLSEMGDCYRAAIACILSADRADAVPHFAQLAATHCPGPCLGWHSFRLARQWIRHEFDLDLVNLDIADSAKGDWLYVATVDSVVGPWFHCVVARSGEIIHDPSGRLDQYRGAQIVEALAVVRPYDPEPDEQVRGWFASLCAPPRGEAST